MPCPESDGWFCGDIQSYKHTSGNRAVEHHCVQRKNHELSPSDAKAGIVLVSVRIFSSSRYQWFRLTAPRDSFGELGRERLLEPYTGPGFSNAPLFADTLKILRENNPRLRHLAVKMSYLPNPALLAGGTPQAIFWNIYRAKAAEELGRFANLKSLKVAYFSSNMQKTAPSLLETLLASPDLVSLSIDGPSKMQSQQAATGQDFLFKICTEYAERGGQPLALKRFHVSERLLTPDDNNIKSYKDRWSNLEKLVEFSGIHDLRINSQSQQDMANPSPPAGHNQHTLNRIVTDKGCFHSLVCLSVERLDLSMATLIQQVGNDLSLPRWFLSRLHFYWFNYNSKKLHAKLCFDSLKKTFWPKTVSFTRPAKIRNNQKCRRLFVDAIVEWQALEALRIPLDLCRRADGVNSYLFTLSSLSVHLS